MSLLRIKQADGSWSNIPAIKGADGIDGKDGKDGAVQYAAGRYIQIDEKTNTINCTVKIGDLVIIDAIPVKDSTNVVSSGGVYDALETKADKTDIAGLGSEAGFITSSVEDLKNYYKKSETYSQEEVNSLIGNITKLTLQVVSELPEVGTEQIIYLVSNGESGNNVFEEWIFVQSKWEMIGSTEVNLSNYYTKEEINDYFQDDLLIYPIKYDIPSNNPYWVSVGSTLETLFINKINEVYKSGKTNFIISIIHIGDPSNRFNCRVRISNSGTSKTISFTALPVLLCDTNGLVTRRCYGNYSYGGGYTYSLENDVFKHKATSGNAFALFNYASDGGAYVKPADVLTKTNTTSFTPTANYHPATKKYVDDAVANAEAGGGGNVDLSNVLTKDNTEEFTPDGDYEPATKKYVDDAVANGAGGSEEKISHYYISVSSSTTDPNTNYSVDLSSRTEELIALCTNSHQDIVNGVTPLLHLQLNYKTISNDQRRSYITMQLDELRPSHIGADVPFVFKRLSKFENAFNDKFILHKLSISYNQSSGQITNASFSCSVSEYPTKKYVDDAVANVEGGGGDSEPGYPKPFTYAILTNMNKSTIGSSWTNNLLYLNQYKDQLSAFINAAHKYVLDGGNKMSIELALIFGQIEYTNSSTSPSIVRCYPSTVNNTYFGDEETTQYYFDSEVVGDYQNSSNFVNRARRQFYIQIQGSWTNGVYTCSEARAIQRWKTNEGLPTNNTSPFTPSADYHPATKKYVDDAVANSGGGSGGADLSNYYNKEEVDAKVAPLVSATDVLTKTNTTEYTPASAYHPATKQYVDQTVASAGGITEESDPTVPLHVKNITQDMISSWNNKLEQDDLTGAIDTAITGKELITFVESCNYPTITGKYDLTAAIHANYYSASGNLVDANFDQITPEFITTLIRKELNKIAEAGNTLDATTRYNGENAPIKSVRLKLPIPTKLQANSKIDLYIWGDEHFDGETDINNEYIKRCYPQLSCTGMASEMIFRFSGKHPDGPNIATMSYLDINYKNEYGDIICKMGISLNVTYTSDTDIQVTKFNSVSILPEPIRQKQDAIPRMLSDMYLDTYIEAESTDNGTYNFSSLHHELKNILYKSPAKSGGVRIKDLLAASIPVVVTNESTHNGANVTTQECLMLQIASVSTADAKAYNTTTEEGVLGGGVDGTYDMKITFADYSKITSKNTSQATLQIRHSALYLNFDDILNTPDEPQYAYKGSFEWYTLDRQQL